MVLLMHQPAGGVHDKAEACGGRSISHFLDAKTVGLWVTSVVQLVPGGVLNVRAPSAGDLPCSSITNLEVLAGIFTNTHVASGRTALTEPSSL
jgi:hypothetical protein